MNGRSSKSVAHPVFKTGRAEQASAWMVRSIAAPWENASTMASSRRRRSLVAGPAPAYNPDTVRPTEHPRLSAPASPSSGCSLFCSLGLRVALAVLAAVTGPVGVGGSWSSPEKRKWLASRTIGSGSSEMAGDRASACSPGSRRWLSAARWRRTVGHRAKSSPIRWSSRGRSTAPERTSSSGRLSTPRSSVHAWSSSAWIRQAER